MWGGLPRERTAPSPWCAEDTVGSGCLQPGCLGTQLSLCSEGECPESRGEPHPNLGFHGDGRQAAWLLPVSAKCDCNRRHSCFGSSFLWQFEKMQKVHRAWLVLVCSGPKPEVMEGRGSAEAATVASSSSGAQMGQQAEALGLSLLQATMRALERVVAGAGPQKQEVIWS